MLKEMAVSSSKKQEIIDITGSVGDIVSESKAKNGICVVYCPHTTAAITINENYDPDVKRDINYALDKIVPSSGYKHMEGNSDGHVKSSLVGISETIIIADAKLKLGRWQGICFCEFDGPRERKVFVKIIKS
jgi:secondary thiamine-phosphate synthase enzyme